MNRRNELLARVYIVMMLFVFMTMWIIGKIFYINVIEGKKWNAKISRNVKWKDIKGDRGMIYSADESILANSIPRFEIRMDFLAPRDNDFDSNVDSLAFYIAKYLRPEKSANWWKKELKKLRREAKSGTKKGLRYYFLKKNLNYDEVSRVKRFPLFKKGKIRGGLIIERTTRRVKPFHELASRTIGVDRAKNKVGLEGAYDKYLKGETAKRLMKKLLGGTWIPLQDFDNKPLSKGADLITNINVRIQDIVHNEILKKLHQTGAEAGIGIVMEVKTGKVVAMTNLSRGKDGTYRERLNYALKRRYAPGSVIKIATTLALLSDDYIDINSRINLEGGHKNFRGSTVRDDEDIGRGAPVNLRQAFVHSSNVAMSKWADIYYNKNWQARKKFISKFKSFGLAHKSGIDLLGEVKPYIKDPDVNRNDFNLNTVPWMAHGYELEMTPIQILTFVNAIANDGKMMKPYLVDKIVKTDEVIEKKPVVLKDKIADDYSLKIIRELLEGVVLEGTAKSLRKIDIAIAGKTGTAQAGVVKNQENLKYNSTFTGYFPADDPQFSMIIVMYGNKKPFYYASQVAVPVFGKIVEKMNSNLIFDKKEKPKNENVLVAKLPGNAKGYAEDFEELMNFINIPYRENHKKDWSKLGRKNNLMEFGEFQFKSKLIPDVRGMGPRDAVYLLENMGLTVELEGVGKVAQQSIAPGTKRNRQKIKLTLK